MRRASLVLPANRVIAITAEASRPWETGETSNHETQDETPNKDSRFSVLMKGR